MEWVVVIGFIILLIGAASSLAGGVGTGLVFGMLGVVIALSGVMKMNDENHRELVNKTANQQNIAVLEINGDNLMVATSKTGKCFVKAKIAEDRIVTANSNESSQLVTPELISRSCE